MNALEVGDDAVAYFPGACVPQCEFQGAATETDQFGGVAEAAHVEGGQERLESFADGPEAGGAGDTDVVELGVTLVERGARGARLTRLGEQLAEYGVNVAEQLRLAEDAAAEFVGSHQNRLRVGGPPSMSKTLLPPVLASLQYQFPTAELSVEDVLSDAGVDMVASGVLDVALCADYGHLASDERVEVRHLVDDRMIVVLPDDHPLAAEAPRPVDLADLAEATWVSGPIGRPSRTQLDDAAAEAGFVPRVPFHTESYDVAQALSEAGVAVSLIPGLALTPLPTTRARALKNGPVRRLVAVLPKSLDHIPLAARFMRGLEQEIAAYPPAAWAGSPEQRPNRDGNRS